MQDALAEWRPIVDEEIAEILHNGTGIVDDIEDGATMRRCEPALLHQYGVDIALNAGNAIYSCR